VSSVEECLAESFAPAPDPGLKKLWANRSRQALLPALAPMVPGVSAAICWRKASECRSASNRAAIAALGCAGAQRVVVKPTQAHMDSRMTSRHVAVLILYALNRAGYCFASHQDAAYLFQLLGIVRWRLRQGETPEQAVSGKSSKSLHISYIFLVGPPAGGSSRRRRIHHACIRRKI